MRLQTLVVFLIALVTAAPAGAQDAAPPVLATIKPVHSLVAAVMEGVGTPALLIRGGVSEHSYVLKPSDAQKIARAKVVFWIGPDLETYLTAPLASLAGEAKVVALEDAKALHRLPARPGGLWTANAPSAGSIIPHTINPHVWLDPQNAVAMTRTIATVLSKTDPVHAGRYAANARAEIARLDALDAALEQTLAAVRTRPYIVFHDAYQYFEARYRLDAIGAVTVEPDRPVGPRRVAQLRDVLKAGQALCIFREPQFAPALIEALAESTKARIGVLDPLGADLAPGPDLYPMLMTRLAGAIVQCLAPSQRQPRRP